MSQPPVVNRDTIGSTSAVGLVSAVFGLFCAFWIPTLAVLFGLIAVVAGTIDLRGSSDPRRTVAALAIALGLGALLATVAVIVVSTSSGPSSGTAIGVVPPPS
jgi:hypothetical protein